jgi:hypothetical protein
MAHTYALHLPSVARFARPAVGDDGLTSRQRRQRGKHYFATAGKKASATEMDALEARMKARHEAETRQTEV